MTESAGLFSRRALVKGGLLGLLVVGASSVGLAAQRTRTIAVPEGGLRLFSEEEYAIFTAVAEHFVPPAAPGVPGAAGVDLALLADRLFERAEQDVQEGVKLALKIVESGLVGAMMFERTKPFTALSLEGRARVLQLFRYSGLPLRRTIYRSFSGLVGSLYYGDPRTWPSVGYPGPPSAEGLRAAYSGQLVDFQALRAKPSGGS